MPLPTKKVSIFIAIAVVIIGIGSVVSLGQNSGDTKTTASTLETTQKKSPSVTDTDGDGVKDWEEELRGTDPQNPDSDGDGTPDGQEIKENRDPLVPGPDDALPEPNINATSTQPTNTELFAREFFASFIKQKQAGSLNTNSFIPLSQSLADRFSANIENESKTYRASDISVVATNKEHIRAYGNRVGSIFSAYRDTSLEGELGILYEAMQSGNSSVLDRLDEHISIYNNIIDALLDTEVPADATSVHLTLLNSFVSLKNVTENMKTILEDPLTASIAINQYNIHTKELGRAVEGIQRYFLSRPVIFSEGEPGYIFEE